jgi:hypothetical protein
LHSIISPYIIPEHPTAASPSSTIGVAATETPSHKGADPRIIVPLVLAIVALIVAGIVIWRGRNSRRRAWQVGIIEPMLDGGGEVHSGEQNHSSEKLGRPIWHDFEDPFETGAVSGRSKVIHTFLREQKFRTMTRELDSIAEAIKPRLETGKHDSSQKRKKEDLNLSDQGGGYGWGLGKRDEGLSEKLDQEYVAEPVPEYSRY